MHLIYKLSFVVGWYVWEETQCLGFAVNTISGTRWGVLERVPRGEGGWPCVGSIINLHGGRRGIHCCLCRLRFDENIAKVK